MAHYRPQNDAWLYAAENRLVQVSGAATASFVYDGDGKRVLATEGGTTTVFIGNYFEWSGTPASAVRYYYAGTTRLAMRRGSGSVTWLLGDHLGSASVSYDGASELHQGYEPWGETRFGEVGTPYQFTGQYRQAIGLYYYGARWYDPGLGRWSQPDQITPDPSDPQDWDRYAYTRNNPVKYIDPDGHNPLLIILALIGAAIFFSQIPSDQYQSNPDNHGNPLVTAFGAALMLSPTCGPVICVDGDCANEMATVSQAVEKTDAQAAKQVIQNGLKLLQDNIGQGYKSFRALKDTLGPAGSGMNWHHIVEQSPTNIARFGVQAIHNTNNVIRLPSGAGSIHQRVSAYYSSIQPLVTGSDTLTVRQWLQTKSFEFQWQFGMELIEKFGGAQYIIEQFGDKPL
jgi:RHS repeat-associated protein